MTVHNSNTGFGSTSMLEIVRKHTKKLRAVNRKNYSPIVRAQLEEYDEEIELVRTGKYKHKSIIDDIIEIFSKLFC